MRIDEPNHRILVRQSWLNEQMICPERTRLAVVRPELNVTTDAALIGTSMHTGIEQLLEQGGGPDDAGAFEYACLQAWVTNRTTVPYRETNINPHTITDTIRAMATAFYENIYPHVTLGGQIEPTFQTSLDMEIGGYGIWLEGQCDYISPDGIIWDWKTSSKPYYMKEKQRTAVQPTAYCLAARNLGWIPDTDIWDFRYGVMVRQETPKAQIGYITRTPQHAYWLRQQVQAAVTTALAVGYDKPWLLRDESALCSAQWCSYYSICRGRFLPE